MLDLRMSWQPVVRPPSPGPLWRGLALVMRASVPYTLDPTHELDEPGSDALHTAARVFIPLGTDRIPGRLFEPKQPAGPSVLLAHGATAEKTLPYFFWIEALLAAGIRVLTVELDGHGANPRDLDTPGIDENLPAALAFLRGLPGVIPDRVGLLGVSLGGACALNAAAADSGVKAVVTVGMPHRVSLDDWRCLAEVMGTANPEVLPVLGRATPNKLLEFLTAPLRIAGGSHGPAHVTTFIDPTMPKAMNRALRYLNPLDNAAKLADTPLLVIGGEWDNIAPAWQQADVYQRASGPKALLMLPRRNHFTVMVSPQAVDAMGRWFRRWL